MTTSTAPVIETMAQARFAVQELLYEVHGECLAAHKLISGAPRQTHAEQCAYRLQLIALAELTGDRCAAPLPRKVAQ